LAALLVTLFTSSGWFGCSGGGSSGSTLPSLPWGRFRADIFGSGLSLGDVSVNPGGLRFSVSLPGGATRSSPVVALDDTIFVGTGAGLLALSPDGTEARLFEGYTSPDCVPCTPPAQGCTAVGPISSTPAVTADGDVVVQTEDGRILHLREDGSELTCSWVSPGTGEVSGIADRSSPLLLTDANDGSLSTVFVGTATGHLLSLNGDGSERWRALPSAGSHAPITASPVVSIAGAVYITTDDGFLHAYSTMGTRRWRLPVGSSAQDGYFLPSPGVNVAVYSVSPEGLLVAANPDGTLKWAFQLDASIAGSPAFVNQVVGFEPTATPTVESTPDMTPQQSPTPTPTPETAVDIVVYVVDEVGTLYGVRDSTGRLEGSVATGASGVDTSPAISPQSIATTSTHPFVIFGAADGFVYATTLFGDQPCTDCEDRQWEAAPGRGGRISVGAAVLSSPAIARDGTIYVTTEEGVLRAIGSPASGADHTATPTPTPTPTPTATPIPT